MVVHVEVMAVEKCCSLGLGEEDAIVTGHGCCGVGSIGCLDGCGATMMDKNQTKITHRLPGDQREQSGSAASWDHQRPTSCHHRSFRQQTFPFHRPLLTILMIVMRGAKISNKMRFESLNEAADLFDATKTVLFVMDGERGW
jgi:hypothetical protein